MVFAALRPRLTGGQGIPEADSQIRVRMSGDGHPRLSLDVLLCEVDVIVMTSIDDLDIHALLVLISWRCRVYGDDDEGVCERVVPYASLTRAGGSL